MRAAVCTKLGPPEESIVIEERERPSVGKGQVRLTVGAAGLNFPDSLIIQGLYQFKPSVPFVPGGELVGTVAEFGEGVNGVEKGQRVVALLPWGAFAEEVVVDARQVLPVPDGVPDDVAAGLILAYATTLYALEDRGRLEPGQTLAVLGAAGGVGLAAVEIGKAMGAKVIACASTDEKLALCRARGADETVNYSQADLKKELKRLSGGGVDVVYDPVGGELAEPALRAMGWGGRYLVIGFASGTIPKLPLNLTLLKSCSVVGVFWGMFTQREPERFRGHAARLFSWVVDGTLKPHIDRTFPLERTAEAIRQLMDRKARGKLILRP
ncbi:MAG: NADPH:quinone oxidoreductase family protein [Myxococcota bacterium]